MEEGQTQERPNVYSSGADLRYGVRVAAGYNDRIVFFSIPPDTFNDISNRPVESKSTTVYGSYVDTVPGLIDLAVDSGPAMTLYAFSSVGLIHVYQLEGGEEGFKVVRKLFGENGEALEESRCCVEEDSPHDGPVPGDDQLEWYSGEFPPWDRNLSEVEMEEERRAWESVADSLGVECEVSL